MKIAAKIFSIVTLVITIICAIGAAVIVIPKIFGVYPYVILSDSMYPEIQAGGVVYIDTKDREVKIGDVYAYMITGDETIELGNGKAMAASEGAKVTHRAVSNYIPYEGADPVEGWYTFQGDSNETADANPVSDDQIIGRQVSYIPWYGFVLDALGSKGQLLLIIGVCVLNFASVLLTSAANMDKDDEKEDGNGDGPGEENKPDDTPAETIELA